MGSWGRYSPARTPPCSRSLPPSLSPATLPSPRSPTAYVLLPPLPPTPALIEPFLFSYHIIPQHLSFSDLTLFPINSRLPTLLINKSILITNYSRSNFALNGSHLTRPNLFSTATVSIYGIRDILNFTIHREPDPSTNYPPMPQLLPPQKPENPASLQPHEKRTRSSCRHHLHLHLPPPRMRMHLQASWLGVVSGSILSVLCLVLGLIETVGI